MTISEEIRDLIEEGSLEDARSLLASAPDGPLSDLAALQIAFAEGSATADQLVQRLVALMRNNPDLPGSRELYTRLSDAAYEAHQSSLAHSHPPPPVRPR